MNTRGQSESFHGKPGIRSFVVGRDSRPAQVRGRTLPKGIQLGDSVRQADGLDAIQQLAVATLRSAQTLELVIYMV